MPLAPRPSKSGITVSGPVYRDGMSLLSFDRYCAEIAAQAELLTSAVQGADMTIPVPSCPDWNLGQLLRHLGGVHRWGATIVSTRAEIAANEIALDGTEREALVGSRTTLDVLNAQQLLLQSQVTLVQNLANLVTDSYQVAAAIGRFTARDIGLHVPLYDDNAYYNAVKNAWVGTGDPTANSVGDPNGGPGDNLLNDNH